MNSYIDAQCRNMIAMINTFIHSCEMGAKRDDGIISKDEEKSLKIIKNASHRFITELNKVTKN